MFVACLLGKSLITSAPRMFQTETDASLGAKTGMEDDTVLPMTTACQAFGKVNRIQLSIVE